MTDENDNERKLRDALATIHSAFASIRDPFLGLGTNIEKQIAQIRDPFVGIRDDITDIAQRLNHAFVDIRSLYGPFFDRIHEAIRELPERTKHEVAALANHGWYIDPDMPVTLITRLAQGYNEGEKEAADSFLTEYINERADDIEKRLIEQCSNRAHILKAAFDAHRRNEYLLSVPAFLIQADGICLDYFGVQLYNPTGRSKLADLVDDDDAYSEALLTPLTEQFPMIFSSGRRTPEMLNRHAILHGESADYGTVMNSCKAISHLAFTAWALSRKGNETDAATTQA